MRTTEATRTFVLILALSLLIVPLVHTAAAEDEQGPAEAEAVTAEPRSVPQPVVASSDVNYRHYDCVGPGPAPFVAEDHSPDPHTETATGFEFGGGLVQFIIEGISVFTSGTCPVVAEDGPVLKHDFTGQYRMTAVCGDGASNEGTTWLDWRLDFVSGIAISQSSSGAPCFGSGTFDAEVTVSITETDALFGFPVEPVGGVELTINQ